MARAARVIPKLERRPKGWLVDVHTPTEGQKKKKRELALERKRKRGACFLYFIFPLSTLKPLFFFFQSASKITNDVTARASFFFFFSLLAASSSAVCILCVWKKAFSSCYIGLHA